MANTEVGTAYLTIMPSLKGFASQLSSETNSAVSGMGSALKSGLTAVASAAAVTAAARYVASFTSAAVDAYADYEQLTGGVEKLFGESSDALIEYAESAYQTAGLSANEYMEQVTSFSASLISSLDGDTEAAVEYADMAITDMADNANTFGSSVEDIQNAYQGFAKQNYTMLDNLKLGYGGTKSEMERLIDDANEIAEAQGEAGDLTIDSYADIVEAIHLVQEEMGITGTTSTEAAETISGSVASMQAAWDNWLTALGSEDVDISESTDLLVESAETALANVLPRVEEVLGSVGAVVAEKLPGLVTEAGGYLMQAAPSLLASGASLLATIGTAISTYAPQAVAQVGSLASSMISGLAAKVPEMLSGASSFLMSIATAASEALPGIVESLSELAVSMVEGIIEHAPEFLTAAGTLLNALIDGILQFAGSVLSTLYTDLIEPIVSDLYEQVDEFGEAAVDWMYGLIDGIVETVGGVYEAVSEGVGAAMEYLSELPEQALEWGKDLISSFIEGIQDAPENLANAVSGLAETVAGYIGFSEPDTGPLANFHTYMPDMIDLMTSGIEAGEAQVAQASASLAGAVAGKLDGIDVAAAVNVDAEALGSESAGGGSTTNVYIDGVQAAPDSRLYALADSIVSEMQTVNRRRGVR